MSQDDTAPPPVIQRFVGGSFRAEDSCDTVETSVLAADSWFVRDGRVLALDAHRRRFTAAALPHVDRGAVDDFWAATVAGMPRNGEWFPRVELVERGERPEFRLFTRPSPERRRSARLATHRGRDPRRTPTVKGPDLAALSRIRTEAQTRGADEAVIVSPEGYVVEGAHSAIAWWRGDILCLPADDLERVDSVTARSLETLAAALGVDTVREHTTANELDGLEVWVLSALHGIRIATLWVDGPSLAERPGRLDLWRRRLSALRAPAA